jgi:hypothetical protein
MKEILIEARHEIHSLRRQNEILRAKVEMIELFEKVLNTKPVEKIFEASPDIADTMLSKIIELEKKGKSKNV